MHIIIQELGVSIDRFDVHVKRNSAHKVSVDFSTDHINLVSSCMEIAC